MQAALDRELLLEQVQALLQQALVALPPPVVMPQELPPHLLVPQAPPPVPQLWELEAMVRTLLVEAMRPLAQALERQDQLREARTEDLLAQLRVTEKLQLEILEAMPGPLVKLQEEILDSPVSTTRRSASG